ncbi:hypothetical protein DPMN_110108 [Dreissena polymorpha]|uniref:Uncharacterized protein n=1 Tax=Dreissena polymorpha TaxID=45954 RepID=A0A9D4KBZ5_DREPO|nr:hypothetical protein DPMN_110108 [Dreissena polymorpha]
MQMTALKTVHMRSNFSKACSSVENVKDTLCSAKFEAYEMQLRTVYVMAKYDLPSNVFVDLLELQCLNGLKCDYYKRPQILLEFEQIIEQFIAKDLFQTIDVMLDETCDITRNELLV